MNTKVWCVAAAVTLAGIWMGGARAQDEAALVSDALHRAIATPEAALLPLPTEVVCGPRVEKVEVSPRRNYALIVRRTVYPARDAREFLSRGKAEQEASAQVQEPGAPEVQVLLWGPRSRRATTVWRQAVGVASGYAHIELVRWLSGTDVAIAQIGVVPGPVTPEKIQRFSFDDPAKRTVFLRINAATGATDTLLTTDDGADLNVSSTEPKVALRSFRGEKVWVVGARGPVSAPMSVKLNVETGEMLDWRGWLPGTSLLQGTIRVVKDGKYVSRQIVLDTTTGTARPLDPAEVKKPAPPVPSKPLPYSLVRGTAILTQSGTDAQLTPLWIAGTNVAASEHGLIAPDSDIALRPATLADAVLYGRQGTLFAVPLATLPLDEFHARRQEQWKKDTLLRARSIGYTAEFLSRDAREPLPAPGDFVRAADKMHQGDPNMARIFQNPATGKFAFTPTYTQTDLSNVKLSEFVIGYLEGPGGRAVIFWGGDSKWEDTPPKP